jgi:opacity protein-like surface antigen
MNTKISAVSMSIVTALVCGQAFAQNAPSLTSSSDWTGFYAGGQIGYADVGTSAAGVDGSDAIGGIILGYDYDFGSWVLGGGLDYDMSDTDLSGAARLEKVMRLKARAGYKINQGLVYAVGGYANAETDTLGQDDGWFVGAGYEHQLSNNLSVAGEVLYHDFKDFNNTGIDVDATTTQIRLAYRF